MLSSGKFFGLSEKFFGLSEKYSLAPPPQKKHGSHGANGNTYKNSIKQTKSPPTFTMLDIESKKLCSIVHRWQRALFVGFLLILINIGRGERGEEQIKLLIILDVSLVFARIVGKEMQINHHMYTQKEHTKMSKIAKFDCEML